MSNRPPVETRFVEDAALSGDLLCAAGMGLRGIGLMLAETELSDSERTSLYHAVIALGALVDAEGSGLFWKAKELEGNE